MATRRVSSSYHKFSKVSAFYWVYLLNIKSLQGTKSTSCQVTVEHTFKNVRRNKRLHAVTLPELQRLRHNRQVDGEAHGVLGRLRFDTLRSPLEKGLSKAAKCRSSSRQHERCAGCHGKIADKILKSYHPIIFPT